MVTTDVLPENQVPPEGVALSDVTVPSQIFNGPVMAGLKLTVTIVVVKQPAANVYVTTEVPVATPVTTPLAEAIVATAVVAEIQVPPAATFERVVEEPEHTIPEPVIAAGAAFTVKTEVAKHPLDDN
jgi:hypothetical protein